MSEEKRQALKKIIICIGICGFSFGLPSMMFSGNFADILILGVIFGIPLATLAGAFKAEIWRPRYGGIEKHSRFH